MAKTIEELNEWIIEHRARSEEQWKALQTRCETCQACMKDIKVRLTAVEKKIIWFTGAAAGAGGVLGQFIHQLFS